MMDCVRGEDVGGEDVSGEHVSGESPAFQYLVALHSALEMQYVKLEERRPLCPIMRNVPLGAGVCIAKGCSSVFL